MGTAARVEIAGRDRFPRSGPYVVAMNHLHWLDIPAVFQVLPHAVAAFVAGDWYRHPVVGRIARWFGNGIPVDPAGVGPRAIATALAWLRGGGVILIAPEGGRSRTGGLESGRPGAAFLSLRSGAPVVPVAAWGQETLLGDLRRGRRGHVQVAVGAPIAPGDRQASREADVQALTERIMAALAELLPPAYRGVYSAAEGGVPTATDAPPRSWSSSR